MTIKNNTSKGSFCSRKKIVKVSADIRASPRLSRWLVSDISSISYILRVRRRKRISRTKGGEEETETETETGPPTREDPGGKEEPFFSQRFFYIGSCYTVNKYYIHPTPWTERLRSSWQGSQLANCPCLGQRDTTWSSLQTTPGPCLETWRHQCGVSSFTLFSVCPIKF